MCINKTIKIWKKLICRKIKTGVALDLIADNKPTDPHIITKITIYLERSHFPMSQPERTLFLTNCSIGQG